MIPDLYIEDIPELSMWTAGMSDADKANTDAFVRRVWSAPQGTIVPTPSFMDRSIANGIVSVVLQHRQKLLNKGGPVEIKKVAEIRGSRFNTGKLRFDLLDPPAMAGLAAVLTKGAEKYSSHNWRQGLPYMEIIASMQRHIMAISSGENNDPETGLPHADHIQCNAMFLSNMMKYREDMDDRVNVGMPPQVGS